MVKIMSNDKCKANVNFLLYNRIYCFMYNIKTTEPELFSDLGMFYIDNFQVCISIAMEVRLQAWNFKPKGVNKVICDYFFKPVRLYYIADI